MSKIVNNLFAVYIRAVTVAASSSSFVVSQVALALVLLGIILWLRNICCSIDGLLSIFVLNIVIDFYRERNILKDGCCIAFVRLILILKNISYYLRVCIESGRAYIYLWH